MTSARVKSLIPFRFKLLAGVIVFGALVAAFHGNADKKPDYSDHNRFRVAAFQVQWEQFGETRPVMDFVYHVGSSKGADSSRMSPFSATGYVTQNERISMFASVRSLENDRVAAGTCQAYVDGNPVHTEVIPEPGKWMRCWAIASW